MVKDVDNSELVDVHQHLVQSPVLGSISLKEFVNVADEYV
jgi:hypothetical protein